MYPLQRAYASQKEIEKRTFFLSRENFKTVKELVLKNKHRSIDDCDNYKRQILFNLSISTIENIYDKI